MIIILPPTGVVRDWISVRAAARLDWTSNATTDHDGDGCRDDSNEDLDDDNDGVPDTGDLCATNATDWTSDRDSTDSDGDGCRDSRRGLGR